MDQLPIQPTDIAIFLVSFAACVYCFILSRRLKALQDTRDGLGATSLPEKSPREAPGLSVAVANPANAPDCLGRNGQDDAVKFVSGSPVRRIASGDDDGTMAG